MKKILLLLTVFTMVFTSCDPLEDINAEIDAQANPIVGDVAFTMSEDDYDVVDKSYGNFDSEEEAKELIPAVLSNKYPVWGNKSSAIVTFNLFNKKNDEKSLIVYEAENQDYTDAGLGYPNISNYDQMLQLLNSLYPLPENRVLVSLTYTERNSGVNSEVEDGFIYSNGTWEKSSGITLEEYKAMGEARAQFSNEDEALVKIPVYLKNKLAYEAPEPEDIEGVMYKLYDSSAGQVNSYVVFFIYDGVNWVKYNNTVNETIQFGHDGTTWVPDNTIKYTLSGADYLLVSSTLISETGYEAAASNLENFGNFNRTGDKDAGGTEASGTSNWNNFMIIRALGVVLDKLNPTAVDDQKYIVTFSLYDGSSGEAEFSLIKKVGVWVENN